MNILGIESSADETAAAVVKDGREILSNELASQIQMHVEYGGIVPEVASRAHLEAILPVIEFSLKKAKITWKEVDGIAVTQGPGLIGALLIGNLAARTLATINKKPLYAVNHVEAHVYANFLTDNPPNFPFLALIVSGGHSQLALFNDHDDYELLGQTRDDAVGEAFDKVAKILGLPYPGGPSVAKAALDGDRTAYKLPMPKVDGPGLDFSFSGLKTAVLRQAQQCAAGDFRLPSSEVAARISDQQRSDLAASFEATAINYLVKQTRQALSRHKVTSVVIAGGVAANQHLRAELEGQLTVPVISPPLSLCTDNAAMIAARGFFLAQAGAYADPLSLKPNPILSM